MEKTILNFATNEGYIANHVERIAKYHNESIYALSLLDKDGTSLPTGLPILVVEENNKLQIIVGEEALRLLSNIE